MRSILATGLVGLLAACSPTDPNPTPTCSAYAPPATADLKTPTSLRNDVSKVLTASCAFASCHGGTSTTPNANNGVYLGSKTAATDWTAVRAGLSAKGVGVDMPLVTPGDPAKSWLMRKMDGDLCAVGACDAGTCGASMPLASPLLGTTDRDVVRRWILQGAPDN